MVKTGQPAPDIVTLAFTSRSTPDFAFEALDLTEVLHRVGEMHFARPRRLTFFQVLMLSHGSAEEEVDFVRYGIRPGTLSFTRPGQVQRIWLSKPCQGSMLLFEPSFTSSGEHDAEPGRIATVVQSSPAIESAFRSLFHEYALVGQHPASRQIIFHEVMALLLRLQRQGEPASSPGLQSSEALQLFRRFETLLDARFAQHRSAATLAQQLGCGAKTLSRACLAVAGLAPKALIQKRVALEAKRLLAHTDEPVKQLAARLGFSEATNFVKFFRRATGELPKEFRVRSRLGG